MRTIILSIAACAVFGLSHQGYAAKADPMDESTNPNTNVDVKTQNLQQKPNGNDTEAERKTLREQSKGNKTKDHNSVVDPSNDLTDTNKLPPGNNTQKLRQKAD